MSAPRSPRITLPVDLSFDRTPPTVYDLLARFWKHPLPNPAPDAAPPPDALPDAAERRRAEQAGWRTTEFTLTADALPALGTGDLDAMSGGVNPALFNAVARGVNVQIVANGGTVGSGRLESALAQSHAG